MNSRSLRRLRLSSLVYPLLVILSCLSPAVGLVAAVVIGVVVLGVRDARRSYLNSRAL